MNILVTASQALVGLFVDDGSLAVAILVIVLVSRDPFNSDARYAARRWRDASNWMPCRALRQCHESSTGIVSRTAMLGGRRDVCFGSLADILGYTKKRPFYP